MMDALQYKRVFARVSLDAVRHNFKSIVSAIKSDTKVLCVLKTDAYGHGAIPIARELEGDPACYGFALATAEEALILRHSGIEKPLLVLGYTFPNAYEDMILKDISFTIFREDTPEEIRKRCRELSSTEFRYRAKVHIKVDTGMGRIGITPDERGIAYIQKILSYPEISVNGIFTHLARADEKDRTATEKQLKIFHEFVKRAEEVTGYHFPLVHASNSAGIIDYPEANDDLVRAGIILYGLWPSDEIDRNKISLRPVLSLYSQIVFLKEIPPGTPISYGGTFVSDKPMKVGTVPVGYGDGYPRGLSDKACVLVNGQKARILGRVCMDQLMIDVTDIPDVSEGDRVTLIGSEGRETITMEELGDISGRFNYEMACDFGKRIPRVYTRNGEVVYSKDYHQDF